jgi:hypothetical protein
LNGILIGAAPYLGLLSTSSVNIPDERAGSPRGGARRVEQCVRVPRVFFHENVSEACRLL